MNGLENKFSDRIDFRLLDADSDPGKSAFQAYQLVGHPSYVILDPTANVLWIGVGEKTAQELEQQLQIVLSTTPE